VFSLSELKGKSDRLDRALAEHELPGSGPLSGRVPLIEDRVI
jgi:hypothetical protein